MRRDALQLERVPSSQSHQFRELLAIGVGAITLLLALALGSYASSDADWTGSLGQRCAELLLFSFGIVAWLFPLEGALFAIDLFRGRRLDLGFGRLAATATLSMFLSPLIHLVMVESETWHSEFLPGGALGEIIGEVLRSLLGLGGGVVVCLAVVLSTLTLRAERSLIVTTFRVTQRIFRFAQMTYKFGADQSAKIIRKVESQMLARQAVPSMLNTPDADEESLIEQALRQAQIEHTTEEKSQEKSKPKKQSTRPPRVVSTATVAPVQTPPVQPSKSALGSQGFALPPLSLLNAPTGQVTRIDTTALERTADQLVEKLAAYGVHGRVDEILPGPVVTMYELEPESGTKVSKIAGLADDLAMALAAQRVRIVAPIPGKARVGFELPNAVRQTVNLHELLSDARWAHAEAALPVALGKDIAGQPVYCDLAKMPHLLVAGATGSGKSVGLNVMLSSLLSKKTPDEVRLLMIDPKVVELAVFDRIPHMLLPVVTDMKNASRALKWAVDEMERRYQSFAEAGARNITTYNERVTKVLSGELSPDVLGKRDDLSPPITKLPYVLVVVDEFADLMMVSAKEVETAVARLAQKARAAGIHVILATQRPSVDVITGMIKANFPARIAFKVSQREDSKTILGRNGAEHLLGMGDMLFLAPGTSDLKRVHSAYISEDEVHAICEHLRAQGSPVYNEAILAPRDDEDEAGTAIGASSKSEDSQYDRAVATIAQAGFCSISQLQRELGVGYNKAAKIVERLEKDGVVGPSSSKAGGRREVLVQPY